MREFLEELYRRNVVRAAALYLSFFWLAMEVAHLVDHAFGITGDHQRYLMIILTIGFIPVFMFSWRYELMREGIVEEDQIELPKRVHHPVATSLDRITIVLLLLAYLMAMVDQFAVEPRSPHVYPPPGLSQLQPASPEPDPALAVRARVGSPGHAAADDARRWKRLY